MSKEVVKKVKSTDIELKDKLVAIQRVTKVTKDDRHFSFAAIVIIGDKKDVVGHGLGKANEVTNAITKGIDDAKKNLFKVAKPNIKICATGIPNSINSDRGSRIMWRNSFLTKEKNCFIFYLIICDLVISDLVIGD